MMGLTKDPTQSLRIFLAILITLVFSTQQGDAVKCFRCEHNDVSSDTNIALKFILQQLMRVSNPQCKMADFNNRYDIDVIECPPMSDVGMKYVCGTVQGMLMTHISVLSVGWHTTIRDCVMVPKNDAKFDNNCLENEDMDKPLKFLLGKAVEAVGTLNLDMESRTTFTGETCYTADDMEAPDMSRAQQCVTCTWNQLESSASILSQVLDVFNQLSTNDCRDLSRYSDGRYKVAQRICPVTRSGETSLCGVIKGEVTTSFLGYEFKYLTQDRGCVSEPTAKVAALESNNHCTTELPKSGSVRDLAGRGLQSLNLGDLNFDGTVCYNYDGYEGFELFGSGSTLKCHIQGLIVALLICLFTYLL